MKWFRKHRGIIFAWMGTIFILFGSGLFFFWYLWWLPQFRRYDPLWSEQFTQEQYWRTVEKQIKLYGWTHDDFGPVGKYGDESWAKWIMDKAESGVNIAAGCSNGHMDVALQKIINQYPSARKERTTTEEWLSWWKQNKDKTQIDWIRDGMAKFGISLHTTPTPDDYGPLLILLGNMNKIDENNSEEDEIPNFVKYNAFRWLRDSDFNPIEFALSTTESTKNDYKQGLLTYLDNIVSMPRQDHLGILRFKPIERTKYYRPFVFSFRFQAALHCLIIFPIVIGGFFMVWAYWLKRNSKSLGK